MLLGDADVAGYVLWDQTLRSIEGVSSPHRTPFHVLADKVLRWAVYNLIRQMHFDRLVRESGSTGGDSPISQEVLWRLGGTSGFVMSAKGTLVCFLVFGKTWLFWVNVTSNWSRESEAWRRRTSKALPGNDVFWRIQGKYEFPAACPNCLHKLTS